MAKFISLFAGVGGFDLGMEQAGHECVAQVEWDKNAAGVLKTVRRLTPIECERLQGFPDNWTSEKMELTLEGNEWKATDKVVKQADGPRYKAMGNAVTVNVAEWIGKQIGKVLN